MDLLWESPVSCSSKNSGSHLSTLVWVDSFKVVKKPIGKTVRNAGPLPRSQSKQDKNKM